MMKSYKNLFEKISSFENLYKSYLKARKGKNKKKEVLKFTYNLERNLIFLQEEMKNNKYKTGKYRNFTIYEPKKREISALPFRDRIVHHAIYSIIEPIFEKTFIHDSYACRKGKGTHRGIEKLQSFLRTKERPKYALKCDIKKYFASIDHRILKKIISKKIKEQKTLFFINEIIDSTKAKKGLPIGNLTSQLFANIYLNSLDIHIKNRLEIKFYMRYMDDFIILNNSRKFLNQTKKKIIAFLPFLKLELHKNKSFVFPIKKGISFLGYVLFPYHKLAKKSTIRNFLRKIKLKIRKYYLHRRISFEKLMESFNSWEAYLAKANTFNIKRLLYSKERFKNVY